MRVYLCIEIEGHGRHQHIPDIEEVKLAIEEELDFKDWRVIRCIETPGPDEIHKEANRIRRTSLLEATREGLREFGTPPPGEGTHPLQRHRDSMG